MRVGGSHGESLALREGLPQRRFLWALRTFSGRKILGASPVRHRSPWLWLWILYKHSYQKKKKKNTSWDCPKGTDRSLRQVPVVTASPPDLQLHSPAQNSFPPALTLLSKVNITVLTAQGTRSLFGIRWWLLFGFASDGSVERPHPAGMTSTRCFWRLSGGRKQGNLRPYSLFPSAPVSWLGWTASELTVWHLWMRTLKVDIRSRRE